MKSVLISQSVEDCIKIINGEKTMIKFTNVPKGTPPIFHKELQI